MQLWQGLRADLLLNFQPFPQFAVFWSKIDPWTKSTLPADSLCTSPAPELLAHLRSPHLRGVHRLDEQRLHLAGLHRRDGGMRGAAF